MSNSCAWVPKVIVNGQQKESELFMSLLSYLGDDRLLSRYYWGHIDSNKNNSAFKNLSKDENGEPKLEAIIKETNFVKSIPDYRLLVSLNKKIGHYKKDNSGDLTTFINNDKNYKKLSDRVKDFNTTSPNRTDYIATVQKVVGEDGVVYITPKVEKRNRLNSLQEEQRQSNQELNETLTQILIDNGISVGALTELEERMGINGVTDFSLAKSAAEGLIQLIRIAKGDKGINALPEEFSHFALRAMKDQSLAKRLINYIASHNLSKAIIGDNYDDYYIKYNGDAGLLAEEAAGKLLADNLIKQSEQKKPYSNLLSRFISLLKNFFSKINEADIDKALRKANNQMSNLADDILGNKIEFNTKSINTDTKLFQMSAREKKLKETASKLAENATKRMQVFKSRAKIKGREKEFEDNQKAFIEKLQIAIEKGKFVEGISSVLLEGNKMLQQLNEKIRTVNNSDLGQKEKFSIYRDANNYLNSYKEALATIKTAEVLEEENSDDMLADLKEEIDKMSVLIGDIEAMYNIKVKPELVKFIETVFPKEGITLTMGKLKGQVITAEEILQEATHDISFLSRWFDSAGESNSLLLQAIDQIKKQRDFSKEERVNDIKRDLLASLKELEDAGIYDTEWMYAKDAEGNLTGYYLTKIDWSKYYKNRNKVFNELKEKYKLNTTQADLEGYYKERNAWLDANTTREDDGKRTPDNKYLNEDFPEEGTPKRKFLDKVTKLKEELDSYLPEGTIKPNKIVMIRKSLIERVKDASNPTEIGKQFWEATKDAWMYRSDDTEYGNKHEKLNFNGQKIMTLPIFFTKKGDNESMNDISTDTVSSMIAYANMAINYNEMNQVIDGLEVLKYYLNNNFSITKTDSKGNAILEKINILGREAENKVFKPKNDLKILQRLQDYYDMQIYGRYMRDEGEIWGISKAKLANNINLLTSINMLGLNMLAGISNVATGTVMMRIESFAGEYYNEKDTIYADKEYAKALPEYIAEIGKRIKTNKLSLFDELFNVQQNFEKEINGVDAHLKTRFGQIFGTGLLFTMNNAGEHWMQNRTALALAHKYKMKDANGKETNLWEALEVKYIDENDHSKGAKLVIKEGYTKPDGSEFTTQSMFKFSRMSAAINERMHGIYNQADKSAIQSLAIGRMAIIFRKWVKPAMNRRFTKAKYSMDMDREVEGYYNTLGTFLWDSIIDLKNGKVNFLAAYKNLTDTEKTNITRALTEMGHLLILSIFLACMDWGGDKKNRPWAMKMLEYQARRLYSELGSMTPGPQIIGEGLKIMKAPMAGISIIDGFLDIFGLLLPYNYSQNPENLVKGGEYKGHTKAYKLFFGNKVVPGMATVNTVRKAVDPTASTNFFKNQ